LNAGLIAVVVPPLPPLLLAPLDPNAPLPEILPPPPY